MGFTPTERVKAPIGSAPKSISMEKLKEDEPTRYCAAMDVYELKPVRLTVRICWQRSAQGREGLERLLGR